MADNFDLKKFLKENKALENLNPSLKSINENESREERADVDAYEYEKGEEAEKKKITKEVMKKQIKDMIVAELELDIENPGKDDAEVTNLYDPVYEGEDADLEEAKKKDKEGDVEDVEVTDTDVEDVSLEDVPADEAPSDVTGGLEDISADMKGTEADLMDHLMKAFQIAKGMGNEKLETQVGNTLKFFVSEYIGGGEQ
jgi:hypothetical protein